MKKIIALLSLLLAFSAAAKDYTLLSPDRRLQISVQTGPVLTYAVSYNGQQLITPSEIGLTLEDGTQLGPGTKFTKAVKSARKTRSQPFALSLSSLHMSFTTLRLKRAVWKL